MNTEAQNLSQFADVNYLDPKEAIFSTTEGGILTLQLGDDFYPKVDLYQAFPFSLEYKYISVRNQKDQEIGVIKDVADFSSQVQEAIKNELQWRYYAPEIKQILNIKEEFGHMYWDVETNRGLRKFVTRGRDDGVYPITDQRLLIIDMTGNRFEILNYHQLDDKSLRLLEPLI